MKKKIKKPKVTFSCCGFEKFPKDLQKAIVKVVKLVGKQMK